MWIPSYALVKNWGYLGLSSMLSYQSIQKAFSKREQSHMFHKHPEKVTSLHLTRAVIITEVSELELLSINLRVLFLTLIQGSLISRITHKY